MDKKIVRLRDKLYSDDKLDVFPSSIDKKSGFNTLVRIHEKNCKYDGSDSCIYTKNTTGLMGRSHLLENSFKVNVNMNQHIFLNDNVLGTYDITTGNPLNPVTVANEPSNILPRSNMEYFAKRRVEYWCAGDGAMNKTVLNTSYAPHNTNTKLYNMIPFRFIRVDESLSDADRRLYKFEVIYPETSPYYGYKGYYLKKIEYDTSKNGINMVVDGVDYIPKWSDTVPDLNADTISGSKENAFKGDKVQQSYINMSMNINSVEFKEWFMFTNGSLGNATISEIGLVIGLDCVKDRGITQPMSSVSPDADNYNTLAMYSEIYDAELFAHLTFDPYTVARDNAAIDFAYRVFA